MFKDDVTLQFQWTPITLYLEFTTLGRGLIAMRSLATSDNMVYDVPYSPRYPKNRTNVRVRSLKLGKTATQCAL